MDNQEEHIIIPITRAKRLNCSFGVFSNTPGFYQAERVFFAYFKTLPNIKSIWWVSPELVEFWLKSNFIPKNKLLNSLSFESYGRQKKAMYMREKIWVFKGLLINLEENGFLHVMFLPGAEKTAQFIIDKCKYFPQKVKKDTVSIIVRGNMGLELVSLNNREPELDLSLNYNADLLPFHEKLLKKIQSDTCSGLALLHGPPGCGKSTYLRYLISKVDKPFIFLPARLALSLDAPELTYLLVSNPQSVLIIEDAEQLLISRDKSNDSSISLLLNLTDGILGECLNITVLASFNKNISAIDPALLRKGRLLGSFEFLPLEIYKAKALVKKLGYTNYPSIEAPMTLADIYYLGEESSHLSVSRNTVGFKSPNK